MKTDVSFSHVQFWLYNCRSIATNDCLCRPSISPSMHASFGLRSRVTCWSSPPRNSCCLLFYWRSVALGLNFKNHQSAHCDQPSIVARRIYAHGRIICCSYCSRLVFCWFLTELLWSRVTLSLGRQQGGWHCWNRDTGSQENKANQPGFAASRSRRSRNIFVSVFVR